MGGMRLRDARQILGLGPDEDPRPLLANFRDARERIAAMVRDAPNETLAMRYQQGLVEFDQALAAVREHIEALGLGDPMMFEPDQAELPASIEPALSDQRSGRRSSGLLVVGIWFLVLMLGLGGGAWVYLQYEDHKHRQRVEKLASLGKQGEYLIENRRWAEATEVYQRIEVLMPGNEITRVGLRGIEAGKAEEQAQFIAYWTGEARAALEAQRWNDAEAAARQVIDRFPESVEAREVLDGLDAARHAEQRNRGIAEVEEWIDRGETDEALAAATALVSLHPGDTEVMDVLGKARLASEKAAADANRARELLVMAVDRDTGVFDGQALDWLREAAMLAPRDEEVAMHLEKMSAYSRTLRVPEDFADLATALEAARENDRILLGPGTWPGPISLNLAVDLQGAGSAETFIECPAVAGSAITVGPDAAGCRISGITFRHLGFDAGEDRYSVALVRGGQANFIDCHFIEGSGHGLAAIEGGQVDLQRCRFRDNGWNGLSATGAGSVANASECQMIGNFGHGVEVWDGAGLTMVNCGAADNSRNGVHSDTTSPVLIEGCDFSGNREFGVVLTKGVNGILADNRIRNNLMGGMVVRKTAAGIRAERNRIMSNIGPGLILEDGLEADSYRDNSITRNSGKQTVTGVDLSTPDEVTIGRVAPDGD